MRTVVVGSGASAVHFALTVLDAGGTVTMVDVGRPKPDPVLPDASFAALKREHPDPSRYFLGERFEGTLFPGGDGEYYGFPPHKEYIFEGLPQFDVRSTGFEPLVSFGMGGLAEAWTGGSFPFNDEELADFPFDYAAIAPHYARVAERVGISGADDDLSRFTPVHDHLAPALDLDEHSRRLFDRYGDVRELLNLRYGAWMGRTRAAVTRDGLGGRPGCSYLGRCLWGCPTGALWTPSIAMAELARRDGFTYLPGRYARRFEVDDANRVTALEVEPAGSGGGDGRPERIELDRLVLAAGTLSSSRIFLESLARAGGGEAPVLRGLMDNRQVLMPFLNLAMVRRPWDPDTYQYHQLALGLEASTPKEYVHGLVTTLKTALIHPVVQSVPMDLASSLWVFRNVHAALGILNVNFHDDRRDDNTLELELGGGAADARLHVRYAPAPDEPERMGTTLATLKKVLWKLRCIVPPGMMHVRPMGASVHYAGALPMTARSAPLTTTEHGESRDVAGLFFVDGTTLPFLPAKNLTFTLMANATRIAAATL